MAPGTTLHEFDDDRAAPYQPDRSFVKTAIALEPVPPDATTVIRTSFGEQTFRGRFYLVAEGDESYGAAPAEFERAHRMTAPNQWVKIEPVRAYQATEACLIETFIGSLSETKVIAQPGDWIVKQPTGEVMVVEATAFDSRYRRTTNA